MKIALVAAIGRQNQIGLNGHLPWHLKSELHYFKHLTMGHHLLMGRTTFDSLRKPLPGRPHIILTRKPFHSNFDSVQSATTVESAIDLARDAGETLLMVIGGGNVYQQTISLADQLFISRIAYDGQADTFFPEINASQWMLHSECSSTNDTDQYEWTKQIWVRP